MAGAMARAPDLTRSEKVAPAPSISCGGRRSTSLGTARALRLALLLPLRCLARADDDGGQLIWKSRSLAGDINDRPAVLLQLPDQSALLFIPKNEARQRHVSADEVLQRVRGHSGGPSVEMALLP